MATRKIAAIYTGLALVQPFSSLAKEILPGVNVMNILDDSLIQDIITCGKVTGPVRRRLYSYYDAACSAGAELIINTCSSIGEAVYGAREFIPVPIVRIDEAMARKAVTLSDHIAVLATLSTTLDPTIRLLEQCAAAMGKKITVTAALADGAFRAITSGDTGTHNQLIEKTAAALPDSCDVLLLAQGSMAAMAEPLQDLTGMNVLSSPRLALEMVRKLLED